MSGKAAGIILAAVGAGLGIFAIFLIQAFYEEIKLLLMIPYLTKDLILALLASLFTLIQMMAFPQYYWYLLYGAFGLGVVGAIVASID